MPEQARPLPGDVLLVMGKDHAFDEKIPALSGIFPLVPPGKRLFIEIKSRGEILPALGEAFAASKVGPQQLPIITFHYEIAQAAKEKFPEHEVS
jgi:glycerophosphoryl diester phosphodiesterase